MRAHHAIDAEMVEFGAVSCGKGDSASAAFDGHVRGKGHTQTSCVEPGWQQRRDRPQWLPLVATIPRRGMTGSSGISERVDRVLEERGRPHGMWRLQAAANGTQGFSGLDGARGKGGCLDFLRIPRMPLHSPKEGSGECFPLGKMDNVQHTDRTSRNRRGKDGGSCGGYAVAPRNVREMMGILRGAPRRDVQSEVCGRAARGWPYAAGSPRNGMGRSGCASPTWCRWTPR